MNYEIIKMRCQSTSKWLVVGLMVYHKAFYCHLLPQIVESHHSQLRRCCWYHLVIYMTEKACLSFVSQNILKITLFTMSSSGAELLFDQAQCLSHDPMNYGKKSNMLLIKEMEDYKSFWQTFTSKHSFFFLKWPILREKMQKLAKPSLNAFQIPKYGIVLKGSWEFCDVIFIFDQ